MKTTNYLWMLLMAGVIAFSVTSAADAEMSLSTGVRYDRFTDDQSPQSDGTEMTIPFGVIYKQERWFVKFETAFSRASVSPSVGEDGDISHCTDSLLAASYMFPDLPVGVVVGLDLNLPTGKARLSENERKAQAGERHDFFEVDKFGEGFNTGLNLGFAKELGSISITLNGLYIFKGKYDATTDIPDDDLTPGNQMIGMTMLKWKAASWLKVESLMAYTHSAPDKTDGKESFQDGDKLMLNGVVRVRRHPIEFAVGVQNTWQAKNKEIVADRLTTEPANSHGRELYGWFDLLYRISAKVDVELLGDLRNYGESDRTLAESGMPFAGKRARYAIGPGAAYLLNDHLSCNVLAKFYTMDEKQDVFQPRNRTIHGMNLSLGVTYTF